MWSLARRFRHDGVVPRRDIVFAFLADEEAGRAFGDQWLVENWPDLFEGCTEAVGGMDAAAGSGPSGPGSFLHEDNAVTKAAEAVPRLGNHRFPLVLTDTVRAEAWSVVRALIPPPFRGPRISATDRPTLRGDEDHAGDLELRDFTV